MNILMLSGDTALARGQEGAFSNTLRHFAPYWGRVDVLTPPVAGGAARQVYDNVFVHPAPWHVGLQPFFIWQKGRRLLRERDYALIISHDYGVFYNGLGAWLLSKSSGVPYVSELHHVEGHPFALTRRELVYKWLARAYIRWVWRRAAGIRVVNRGEMPTLLRDLGVPAHKILVLPSMYLDFATFHPMPTTSKRYDVLFVGRLVANKGIFTILEAVAQVRETHPELSLCVVGEGPLQKEMLARSAALGLAGCLSHIPRVDTPQELAHLYNAARMLVCASTSEGGPRVTVEAMACGTPVITTPVGIMQDLMEDGINCLVFPWHAAPLAEKIRALLEDEPMRLQLGENGEIAVQGFRADVIIHQYARGYQELIEKLTPDS